MASKAAFHIAVMPGDGIGREVMEPCLDLLDQSCARAGAPALKRETLEAGAGAYARTGTAMSGETLARAGEADAILLGAMGLPDVRYPDGREVAPQVDLREHFQLFAGVRPIRTFPGMAAPLADPRGANLDVVLIRESTEGFFAGRGKGTIENDEVAREHLEITRKGSERLFDFAFDLARRRKARGHAGRVTCVDKANIFQSFAFFRKIYDERAAAFPDIERDYGHVDATALRLVTQPWRFDVLVTENLFGDILSDLGAGLMGGMGMAPSADLGAGQAVFQPCHGTAPDIAGEGKANPAAMFLSAAMMLDWLGEQHDLPAFGAAAGLLRNAVERAFADGDLLPMEFGGNAGTKEITDRVSAALTAQEPVTA